MKWEARTERPLEAELIGVDRIPVIVNDAGAELTAEQAEHRAAAIDAARALAAALDAELVQVSVAGNANPDHRHADTDEGERITVSVWTVARKADQ